MKRRTFLGSALALFIPTVSIANPQQSISTDELEFYKFFEKFNGFQISKQQKNFYDWYKKDLKMISMGRQVGATTFLITLAAWLELEKNVSVLFVSTNGGISKICHDRYYENVYKNFRKLKGPMFTSSKSKINQANAITYHFIIFDTHVREYELKMSHPSFSIDTYDVGYMPLIDTYTGINKI